MKVEKLKMQVKHKYIFFLSTLLVALTIAFASMQIINNTSTTSIVPEPVIDIKEPDTSNSNINHIEFVQAGNNSFIYDPADPPNNYLKTGEGPFTMRFHLTTQIPSDERLRITLKGYDPSYHSTLHIDTAMMDELGPILQAIVGLIDYVELALHSTSRNEVVKYITSSDYIGYTGGYHVYEWTPSETKLYKYQTRIYLGETDLTSVLETLGLEDLIADIMPDLYPTEEIQDIKYNVINMFSFTQEIERTAFFGLIRWWEDLSNGVSFNGVTATTHEIEVTNEDHTAPTYSTPEASQETAVDDWQIKISLQDEAEGSGVKNDSVYIWYSVNGGDFVRIEDPMLLGDDFNFYGTLPSQFAGSEIKYYISYSDRAGNVINTEIYTFYANPLELQPVAILLIGIAIATIATIAATRIYRNRHQPRVITLPTKKKVDKYYKKVKREGGNA